MNADDLDFRARTGSGCILADLVDRLLELGHHQVVEAQAARGEWFCARAQARLPAEQGRHTEALRLLDPFVATGWWTAVAAAELREAAGDVDRAITYRDDAATYELCALYAEHGRAEEGLAYLDDLGTRRGRANRGSTS